MDAHLFRRFAQELLPVLKGARLVKIQEPYENVYTFNIDLFSRASALGKKVQLILRPGRKDPFLFLSTARLAAGAAPSAKVMRLRKYCAGHSIRRIEVLWQSRELHLLLTGAMPQEDGAESQDAAFPAGTEDSLCARQKDAGKGRDKTQKKAQSTWLVLSLRDGPRLHFAEEGEVPSEEPAVWPDASSLQDALEDWRSWPVLTPALRRTMAKLDALDAMALLIDLEEGGGDLFVYKAADKETAGQTAAAASRVVQISAWPLPESLQKGAEECREDILAAVMEAGAGLVLTEAAKRRSTLAASPWQKKERKAERLLKLNTEDVTRLKKMCARQQDARCIQANLWQLEASRHMDSVTLPNEANEECTVSLDPRFSLRENMERFFHMAKRGERGLVRIEARRRELEEELEEIRRAKEAALLGLAPAAPRNTKKQQKAPLPEAPSSVQCFVSSDGMTLLRGRNAKGNLEVRRMASPHDVWVHVDGGAGAHVVIRRSHAAQEIPQATLDEAGSLSASKSFLKDEVSAKVNYCEIRHVRQLKGAVKGTMRMDKILFTRQVAVRPELEQTLLPKAASEAADVK